jgi:hypothetical protein
LLGICKECEKHALEEGGEKRERGICREKGVREAGGEGGGRIRVLFV